MSILVDTSVWVDFFRDSATPQALYLERHSGIESFVLGDLILVEILQGIRENERFRVETALRAIPVKPLVGEVIARQSAANYHLLRRSGITVRRTIDCLIATWCIENQVALLHSDRDFLPFVNLGLVEVIPFRMTLH